MTVSKDHTDQLPKSLQRETAFAGQPQQAGRLAEELLDELAGGTMDECTAYQGNIRRKGCSGLQEDRLASGVAAPSGFAAPQP